MCQFAQFCVQIFRPWHAECLEFFNIIRIRFMPMMRKMLFTLMQPSCISIMYQPILQLTHQEINIFNLNRVREHKI
ncbi:hypothetical protein VK92_02000 [Burkholderia sp. LK4]|nr:hypothetical protein VL00_26955 [Burkholderia cepacia]KMN62523.1 hypothetical protein VK92_02000 [Burkholderia sp. LK4]KVN33736.1 hypothetical protein WT11_15235 [Burkholderia stagnalis]